jgi:hypothetical protein
LSISVKLINIIKKNIASISIILIFVLSQVIGLIYPEYYRYFMYLGLILVTPIVILGLIKQRKEDKLNGTQNFQSAISRMLIIAVILGVFYFIT